MTESAATSLSWHEAGSRAQTRGVVFVSSGGGPPSGWPFILREVDGALWCTTYRTSAKMRQVAEADRAVALLFEHEHTALPYAVVEGHVEIVEPTPELVAGWFGVDAADMVAGRGGRVADRLLRGKRVFLKVVPDREPTVFT